MKDDAKLIKQVLDNLQKLNEKKKRQSKKDKNVGLRSMSVDGDPKISKLDFMPQSVLDKMAKNKNETLEDILESFIVLQENPNSNHDSNYDATEGSERDKKLDKFKKMLKKAAELIKKGKTKEANKLKQRVYDGRNKMEEKERVKQKNKKNESLSVSRYQLNELISETVEAGKLAIMLEKIEELEEKKKKKKKKSGGLSASIKKSLNKKADKRCLTRGSVYTEFRKGLAAYYSSGSRKGMTPHQWAYARVNSANPSKSWASVKKRKTCPKKKKK